ncbi:hypothetical protein A2Z00_00080 [Candidatus Gottesmanbacteria bacterium RBG_13_45_10]|uniref:Aminoacyl-transfer RNA synthetases class-II family profile domain-containing protein n=1 Tax=Candidatus Gottesmanbacteria bacterium RBG_13_45_10 TaxID=1798370 RepID=A0A1F5ZHT8_9BACT|nr:MAG: hypothetical protein A2Z00_00080 [Candidatus Gottesmanbacteria bacterium RBG_13_45_10]
MNLQPIFIREHVVKSIREYFYTLHFHEVITPTLQGALPLEPNIYAFETTWFMVKRKKRAYLSVSPESGLKKMIALGIGNCFAIAKSFRNIEDAGSHHIPEFMMLEWYRTHATYRDIMDDTKQLVQYVKRQIDTYVGNPPGGTLMYQGRNVAIEGIWPTYSLVDLFRKYAGVALPEILDDKKMVKAAFRKGYRVANATWEQLFHQIFLNEIEPKLGINPCFVTDFPSRISPLCAVNPKYPYLAQRFELYIAQMELANGNTENTDIQNIKTVFANERNLRRKRNISAPPIDDVFIKALERMHASSFAGCGLGIDRLAMILANAKDITDVEPLSLK